MGYSLPDHGLSLRNRESMQIDQVGIIVIDTKYNSKSQLLENEHFVLPHSQFKYRWYLDLPMLMNHSASGTHVQLFSLNIQFLAFICIVGRNTPHSCAFAFRGLVSFGGLSE